MEFSLNSLVFHRRSVENSVLFSQEPPARIPHVGAHTFGPICQIHRFGVQIRKIHCESDPEANTHQIHSQILAKYTVGVCCCWQTGWSHSKHFHVKSNMTISISGLEGGHMTAA